jgi:hypothetical protein
MAKNKTAPTTRSVSDFIDAVENEIRRDDSRVLIKLFKELTGLEPHMWGPTIVGFGSYHYKYASGHEGDAPIAGFSPRKDAFAIYLATDYDKKEALLKQLGKHKMGVACLYIKKLDDVKIDVLKEMIKNSIAHVKKLYPSK